MEKLCYIIRKSENTPYYIYDVQIFRRYGTDHQYYSQILRFNMQSNSPDNFAKSYGFDITTIDLHYLEICTKFLKLVRNYFYSRNASKELLKAFNKMKIEKSHPNIIFNR